MCLKTIDLIRPKNNNEVGLGYKLVRKSQGKYYSGFWAVGNLSNVLPKELKLFEWVKDSSTEHITAEDYNERYPAGFHFFLSTEDAISFKNSSGWSNADLIEIQYKNLLAEGIQDFYVYTRNCRQEVRVFVAKEIRRVSQGSL